MKEPARHTAPVLDLPIVTYRRPGPPGTGTMWFARSVTTGHVAHGRTEASAVEGLLAGIDALLALAHREGISPLEWHAAQTPDPQCQVAFDSAEQRGCLERLPRETGPGGCVVQPRKALCEV
jgi:hypothetical protein